MSAQSKTSGSDLYFYEVRPTHKYGRGVFCINEISKGSVIRVLSGERLPELCLDALIHGGGVNNDDPLQVRHDQYLLLDDISICFNHSCEPNAGLRGESTLVALRSIRAGEEITYDYSTTVDPNNHTFTSMTNCLCGSSRCRKSLGNVMSIPADVLEYYKREGALQDYIILELNNIQIGS